MGKKEEVEKIQKPLLDIDNELDTMRQDIDYKEEKKREQV